jgi:hypothetical protein
MTVVGTVEGAVFGPPGFGQSNFGLGGQEHYKPDQRLSRFKRTE